jgi:ornithine cyclodeaminase/alanine dehydrogenase-like protein (mu-crystallin family)
VSSALPHLDADALKSLVSLKDAIVAIREAFASAPVHNARQHVALDVGDDLLMMPGVHGTTAGVKIVTVVPGNIDRQLPLVNGLYLLLDRATGLPRATMDGDALTTLRTPATSALATDVLAREDATTLGIFGTGVQARVHIRAMLAVRPHIESILISGRVANSAQELIAEFAAEGIEVHPAPPEQVAGCSIVCCCTSSLVPVTPTSAVRPGSHLNLVGSYSLERREVEAGLIEMASVYVDDRGAATRESGDLMYASVYSDWSFSSVRGDLVALARGTARRRSPQEITLFKSLGLAIEDLAVASLAAKRAGV